MKKQCLRCETKKPLEEFYNLKRSKDGKDRYCKECRKLWKGGIKKQGPPLNSVQIVNGTKRCTRCETWKPVLEFRADKNQKSGLSVWCRECYRVTDRERRLKPKIIPEYKICTNCKEEKPQKDFYRSSEKKDGLQPWCKFCIQAKYRKGTKNYYHVPVIDGKKRCSSCRDMKDISEFYKISNPNSKWGLSSSCKTCEKERSRARKPKEPRVSDPLHDQNVLDGLTKNCRWCGIEKSVAEFSRRDKKKNTYSPHCKSCQKRYRRGEKKGTTNAVLVVDGKKPCSKCKQIKPVDQFYKVKETKSGFSTRCKDCRREVNRKIQTEWRERNPNYMKNWVEENRHAVNELVSRRRALQKEVTVGKVNYDEVVKRDGLECYLCGGMTSKGGRESNSTSIDHVIAIGNGGSHSMDNLKVAHFLCNCIKNNREDWQSIDWQKVREDNYDN